MGLDLTRMVLEREELKKNQVTTTQTVWQARCALVKAWKAEEGPKGSDMGVDESLLHDKERVVKKAKLETMGFVLIVSIFTLDLPLHSRVLAAPRRSSGVPSLEVTPNRETHSPLTAHLELPGINLNSLSPIAYVAVQSAVRERYLDIQNNVEKDIASMRARDSGWEDLVDVSSYRD